MTQAPPIPPNDNSAAAPAPPPDRATAGGTPRVLPRRLYRDPKGPIGGVASGMAGYFGVDPVLVRLLWLVAFFSGIGFFAYAVFWVIVPKAPAWPPASYPSGLDVSDSGGGNAMVSGLLIVALAAILSAHWDGLADMVLPVTLVGFGIFLLNQRSQRRAVGPVNLDTDSPSERSSGTESSARSTPEATGKVTGAVFSIIALLSGVAWMLHSSHVLTVSITAAAATALVVVGAGLVASLWFGRARGLIPFGMGLGVLLLIASAVESARAGAVHFDFDDSSDVSKTQIGPHRFTPVSVAELQDEYELGVGELVLDLSALDLADSTEHVRVEVGVGTAIVIVPADVSLEIRGEVGVGKATALDQVSEGLGREIEKVEKGPGAGTLIVDFEVGIGEGTVRREF